MKKDQSFREFLDIMHNVMNKLSAEHMDPDTFGTDVSLHRAEIHTIQSIGENEGINPTRLASLMGITKGAISQTISKLDKKGLVKKIHNADNSKEINLYLTQKGWVGFKRHDTMHMRMYDIVKNFYGKDFQKKIVEFSSMFKEMDQIIDRIEKSEIKK